MGHDTISEVNAIASTFRVEQIVDVSRTGSGETLYFLPVTPYTKTYEDKINPSDYCDNPDRSVLLAHDDGVLVGQLIMRRNWNGFAFVEDILVDQNHRRAGVGTRLLEESVLWAKQRSLAGVALETQNTNVPACKLYRKFGFRIGGFDRFLYFASTACAGEIAIYWYYILALGQI